MWFVGFLIGAAFGAAIGGFVRWDEAWLFFGAAGAVVAIMLKTGRIPTFQGNAALEERITALERDLREIKERLASVGPAESARGSLDPGLRRDDGAASESPRTSATAAHPAAAAHVVPAEAGIQKAPEEVTAPETATQGPPTAAPAEPSWLWQKLFGGNILAKVGVVLLLIGVGSGLKLAIDFGMFPPSVRLLIATVAALAMIAFGYSRMSAAQHRMFGLALQGGGFGILYLVTYFAFARYGYFGAAPAFALFAGLGIACVFMALRFEGEPLAILGIAGAFLAPLLASTGAGSHVILFSYYAVLDVLALGIYAWRAWRGLATLAFAFTVFTGMVWASNRFTPALFASTESFLVLFAVLFSVAPLVAHLRGRADAHWSRYALIFGTPVAAAASQEWLMTQAGFERISLAWSAVAAGVYYAVLTALILRHRAREGATSSLAPETGPAALRLAHGAIAVGFFTLAIPLAFGAEVTSAFWAIEGVALVWYGVSQRSVLPYAAGLVLQLAAGVYFLSEPRAAAALAVLNAIYVSCFVLAACGAATAWLTRKHADGRWLLKANADAFAVLTGVWALAWWLAGNFADIDRFAPPRHEMALYVGVLVITAWALMAFAIGLAWTAARYAALVLAAIAVLPGLYDDAGHIGGGRHALHDTMVFALPAAFVTLYLCLRRNERANATALLQAGHVYAALVLAAVLLRELLWVARELAPNASLWQYITWQLVPAAFVFVLLHLHRHKVWPLSTQARPYLVGAAPVLLLIATLAALIANVDHAGGGTGLPYLPLASFFDAPQIAVLATLVAWRSRMAPSAPVLARLAQAAAAALGFIWLSAMAMRLAHHWVGVPFNATDLIASGAAQSILSLAWTALALTLMISATRSVLRRRWFLGFALLGIVGAKFILIDVVNKGSVTWTVSLIGVALLILAASYFSPAPPRAERAAT